MRKYLPLRVSPSVRVASTGQPTPVTIPRPSQFTQKLAILKQFPNDIDIITDYDYTLTRHEYEGQRCDSLFGMWVKPSKCLPEQFQKSLASNYSTYGPYETDSSITHISRMQLVDEFYRLQLKLYDQYAITLNMADQTLQEANLVFRDNFLQLMDIVEETNIPFRIVSGGISDFIFHSIRSVWKSKKAEKHSSAQRQTTLDCSERQLNVNTYEKENITRTLSLPQTVTIHSNQFKLPQPEEKDSLISFSGSLVHSYNKYAAMALMPRRRHCILMGDLQSDIYMARGCNYSTVMSVFYAKQAETDQRAFAEDKFDVIIEGEGGHQMLCELLKRISGRREIDWKYLFQANRSLPDLIV